MPKFSIVTVTLNPGSDLKPTFLSVLNQDFPDWELIVKDGGSSDDSLAMLPHDPRIRVAKSVDSGVYDAMNQALQLVTGDYVCFLNAGDYYMDNQVLSVVSRATEPNTNAEFIYGDVHKPLSRSQYELYPAKLSRFFLFNNMVCHQCWFVKRTRYIENGGFETVCKISGDYRYFLQLVLRDRVAYQHISKVVVAYKGDGLSTNPKYQLFAKKYNDQIRREIFSYKENLIYSWLWKARELFKRAVYDPFLYKPWKIWQRIHVRCRHW